MERVGRFAPRGFDQFAAPSGTVDIAKDLNGFRDTVIVALGREWQPTYASAQMGRLALLRQVPDTELSVVTCSSQLLTIE